MSKDSGHSDGAPTVSVVIPTYNSASFVVEAVRSTLNQTLRPHEVIVVDDGSRDETQRVLAPFVGRIVSIIQENAGVAHARNTGVARATGMYVSFLDADDAWHPRKLELQLSALSESRGRFGAVGTQTFEWPTETFPSVMPGVPLIIRETPWNELAVKNSFTTSSMLVKRALLTKVGPFDESLQGPEDHDMWLRLSELEPVGVLAIPLTGYREVQGSLSKQAARMEIGMLRILDKIDERGGWQGNALLRRAALGYVTSSCAYMYGSAGEPWTGVDRLVKSLLAYPLPYKKGVMRMRFARLKLLSSLFRAAFNKR